MKRKEKRFFLVVVLKELVAKGEEKQKKAAIQVLLKCVLSLAIAVLVVGRALIR